VMQELMGYYAQVLRPRRVRSLRPS
jgi:hypothetical protein